MTTLRTLLTGKNTLVQLTIMERADRLFPDRAGRYFGGVLTDADVTILTAGLKLE